MPKIHGVNASPFVRKTRVVLAEKSVEYELVPVMPIGVSDAFKQISPLGKIPCYQDGDFSLPDSSCICAYLERAHPDPPLYPSDPKSLGRALWYEEYADSRLAESVGPVFFHRIVQAKILKQELDQATIDRCLGELVPPTFDYLDAEVGRSSGDGIVGGRFSIADIAIATMFVNYHHAGERIDVARWPELAAYVDQMLARPSFKDIVEEETAALASL